ncbi:hypothetical protein [Plantactinospora sp. CA-290183]|uniref:hypothetical protein n=1 Tax=Plantactinospora sp. CA-290183 TaxID=3240006 RepID=UPI003D8AD49C
MRHLGSLLLGLVSVPLLWVLTGVGLTRFNTGIVREQAGGVVLGLALLVVAGVLLAVLLVPRISPVGPAVAGLCYLLMAAWTAVDFRSLVDVLPASFLGTPQALTAPIGGLCVLLGVALLGTVASPRRWRSGDPAPAGYPVNAGQQGHPQYPAPGPGVLPPNYGPAIGPANHPQSAPPNYGPTVPSNYGPTPPQNAPWMPPQHAPTTPPNAPFGPPYQAPPPATPAQGRPPSPQSGTDGTQQFTGGAGLADDGTDGVTRRLGDDSRPS